MLTLLQSAYNKIQNGWSGQILDDLKLKDINVVVPLAICSRNGEHIFPDSNASGFDGKQMGFFTL